MASRWQWHRRYRDARNAGLEDDAPIPPRGWLLGNTFCRGFID
jgi:hypothetical protein